MATTEDIQKQHEAGLAKHRVVGDYGNFVNGMDWYGDNPDGRPEPKNQKE
jgi:hypothetical protein